jgi:hypothetical protein
LISGGYSGKEKYLMDYTALHSEISNDPASMGYSTLMASGSDAGVADLMNRIGTSRISRKVVTKEIFFVDFGVQMLGIFSSVDLSTAFAPLLKLLDQVGTIDYSHPIVQNGLASIVGVPALGLTALQVQTITTRPCSRSETLFGVGISVSSNDVASAYGRI